MTDASERRLTVTWLLLVAITLVSWWIGSGHGGEAYVVAPAVTIAVLAIAAFKVHLIVSGFMEARRAPRVRLTAALWVISLFLGLLAAYGRALPTTSSQLQPTATRSERGSAFP